MNGLELFQFLIGRLTSFIAYYFCPDFRVFQFLIGRLTSKKKPGFPRAYHVSFNSS